MRYMEKKALVEKLRSSVRQGIPIILAGAGCGLSAKAEEAAGADLIMAYNSGIYRMDGHVSLVGYRYYSDGNQDTLNLARELMGAVSHTPVIAGVCADDPWREKERFLEQLMELGYSGITNVPSIAGAAMARGSVFGADARYYGMGAAAELDMVRRCRKKDMFTAMYAYNAEDVRILAGEGADLISVHVGGTAGGSTGSLGEKLLPLEAAAAMTDRCFEIAMRENPEVLLVTHGGPFEDPEAMRYCFAHARCHGYIGASGIERIPVEKRLTEVYAAYGALKTGNMQS